MSDLSILYIIVPAYFLGSIPFGLLVTKLAGYGDIRQIGSGNIGATNVLRTGKKGLALLTLLLDGGKGAVAILLTRQLLFPHPNYADSIDWGHDRFFLFIAGLSVLSGHMFPVWLKFKGGKGVATTIGVITAMNWVVGVCVMLTWMTVAILSRYSSLAALVSFGLSFIYAWHFAYGDGYLFLFTLVIIPLIFWKHRANILRLLNGTESRIGKDGT